MPQLTEIEFSQYIPEDCDVCGESKRCTGYLTGYHHENEIGGARLCKDCADTWREEVETDNGFIIPA